MKISVDLVLRTSISRKARSSQEGFRYLAKFTNLEFVQVFNQSVILIAITSGIIEHFQYRGRQGGRKCSLKFDGLGGILPHAFLPTVFRLSREIHLDKS